MKLIANMAVILAAGIAGFSTNSEAADTVKVGFVMSFSGWFQPIDAATINGALLAVKEINAAGGVLGKQIEVLKFDNKSEPPLGADGAVEVIGQGAKAILLPTDFDFGAPGAYVAQQNNVIAFSGASDPKFGVTGIGSYAYSISNVSQGQGAAVAEWAFGKGWRSAYVLIDTTVSYAKSLCGGFSQRWKEMAGEGAIVGEDSFMNSDPSIASQTTRITNLDKKPDVVMLCSYAPGGPSAIRQLRAAGIDQPIVAGESLDGDYWMGTVPNLSNFYVAADASIHGDDPDPAMNDFFNRYEAEYKQRSDVSFSIKGYSAIQAWARAAEKAGSFDADKVAAVLDGFKDEPLLIGPTTYSPELHIQTTRPLTVVEVQNGKFSAVGKVSARPVLLD
ncbi:ABC transporter substrate-binding protein [Brucella tritici]|uniref:ABC transporter substrate-binding protein n=1 Tax=Brucella tritici TaxID=94626 RepID=UPI00159030C8|nr:ABC transporter substrate-binding protein [Brucella tritici]